MALFDRIWKYFSSTATGSRYGRQPTEPTVITHDNTVYVGVDGALQVSTVWACVTLLSENIASLPLKAYQKDPKTGRRTPVPVGKPINTVLSVQPNEYQTPMEFWMTMTLALLLRGNAFALKTINGVGETVALWPLSADQMEVELTREKKLIYHYYDGETKTEYPADKILHLKGMGGNLVGLSPLDYMRASVNLSVNAQNQTNRTFRSSGRRPGILYTGGHVLKNEQREQVRKKFNDIVTGTENELYLLEGDFRFESLTMSPADVQLLETRKFSVQDIARWFGVPSVLVNDTGETTSLGSSVEQIIEGFYKLKLRTVLQRIEQAIELRVLTPAQVAAGYFVEFNMDTLLRSNLKERMEVYSQGTQNGIYTRNEARGFENLEPIDGADKLTCQTNLIDINDLGKMQQQANQMPQNALRKEPIKQ